MEEGRRKKGGGGKVKKKSFAVNAVLLKLTPFQAFPRDWRRKNGSGRRRRKRTATTKTMRTTTKHSMKSPYHMRISEDARRTLSHIVGKLLKMSHLNCGISHQFL